MAQYTYIIKKKKKTKLQNGKVLIDSETQIWNTLCVTRSNKDTHSCSCICHSEICMGIPLVRLGGNYVGTTRAASTASC